MCVCVPHHIIDHTTDDASKRFAQCCLGQTKPLYFPAQFPPLASALSFPHCCLHLSTLHTAPAGSVRQFPSPGADPEIRMLIWEMTPKRTGKEMEMRNSKGTGPHPGALLSRLLLWATGTQSCRTLGDRNRGRCGL